MMEPRGVVTEKAARMILAFEGFDTGGWPGGASGVTIGHGYDLGYHTLEQFTRDWQALLSPSDFARLARCIGLKGEAARRAARQFKTAPPSSFDRNDAMIVFRNVDLPRWEEEARAAFAGFDSLPEDAEGALISLVFNRGADMGDSRNAGSWERRREMRDVRFLVDMHAAAVNAEAWERADSLRRKIAAAIRKMKRLWIGKGLDGLLRRRDAEADLVESTVGIRGSV